MRKPRRRVRPEPTAKMPSSGSTHISVPEMIKSDRDRPPPAMPKRRNTRSVRQSFANSTAASSVCRENSASLASNFQTAKASAVAGETGQHRIVDASAHFPGVMLRMTVVPTVTVRHTPSSPDCPSHTTPSSIESSSRALLLVHRSRFSGSARTGCVRSYNAVAGPSQDGYFCVVLRETCPSIS